jgi:hypothetical protein
MNNRSKFNECHQKLIAASSIDGGPAKVTGSTVMRHRFDNPRPVGLTLLVLLIALASLLGFSESSQRNSAAPRGKISVEAARADRERGESLPHSAVLLVGNGMGYAHLKAAELMLSGPRMQYAFRHKRNLEPQTLGVASPIPRLLPPPRQRDEKSTTALSPRHVPAMRRHFRPSLTRSKPPASRLGLSRRASSPTQPRRRLSPTRRVGTEPIASSGKCSLLGPH